MSKKTTPWLEFPQWKDGIVRTNIKQEFFSSLGLSFFLSIVYGILVVKFFGNFFDTQTCYFIIGFPSLLLILLLPLNRYLFWKKYGDVELHLGTFPGLIGGKFSGAIKIPKSVVPETPFKLTLACEQCISTGSGKNSRSKNTTLWESTQTITPRLLQENADLRILPVLFEIPYETLSSQEEVIVDEDLEITEEIEWLLSASAETPGIDFCVTFQVPIFKTSESRPDFQLDHKDQQILNEYTSL